MLHASRAPISFWPSVAVPTPSPGAQTVLLPSQHFLSYDWPICLTDLDARQEKKVGRMICHECHVNTTSLHLS